MKKNILTLFIALSISTFVLAQVTPEVPRNYKPQPKELLPMPDSLTNEMIFPVLGKFNVVNHSGDSTTLFITLDKEKKGVVWVSGLSEGKFKAILKGSPAIYKIPSQKTYFNDPMPVLTEPEPVAEDESSAPVEAESKKLSGKSVTEGTLIYDKDLNELYINLGGRFNEDNPASVFAAIKNIDNTQEDENAKATSKSNKKTTAKDSNYTGSKIITEVVAVQ